MLTDDKIITTPAYWDKIYQGRNDNAKVDASNTQRPANPFDRFGWVAQHAEGPNVLEVAAGHAHICKRIRAAHPDWFILASDQAPAARVVSNFTPYEIFSAYDIPYRDKQFTTLIACQCLEYIDDLPRFFKEAQRVAKHLLFTVPIGDMAKWSQLRIFTEENVINLVAPFEIFGLVVSTVFERHEDLLLVKIPLDA